jgi:DNA-directed RNA polymerase subunit RPC12/RpoP
VIRFSCPRCKSVLEAPDHQGGDKIECPKCQQRLQIPFPPRNKTILAALIERTPAPETAKAVPIPLYPLPMPPPSLPVLPTNENPPPLPPPVRHQSNDEGAVQDPVEQTENWEPAQPRSHLPSMILALSATAVIAAGIFFSIFYFMPEDKRPSEPEKNHGFGFGGGGKETTRQSVAPRSQPGAFTLWDHLSSPIFMILLFALVGVFWTSCVAVLVWVYRDAQNRSMSGVLWMLIVFFLHFLGLVVYVACRPQGQLVRCTHCSNKRLKYVSACPHCGFSVEAASVTPSAV